MSEWLPIETAPKDGEFLAFGFYFYPGDSHPTTYLSIAWRSGTGAFEDDEGIRPEGHFSHWCPFPDVPAIPSRSPSESKTWKFANE